MTDKHVLLVGASRGLGLAMAVEFLKRGWSVVGTVQAASEPSCTIWRMKIRAVFKIESLDIAEPDQIAALHDRLSGRSFDVLFHNAGIADANPHQSVAEVSTEEFVRVIVTNALSPMRVIAGITGPCSCRWADRHHVVGTGKHQQQRKGRG
jgi:NAD(P)-dependent dehydrogenase (short-subunit alcohol dehydrogenase family)